MLTGCRCMGQTTASPTWSPATRSRQSDRCGWNHTSACGWRHAVPSSESIGLAEARSSLDHRTLARGLLGKGQRSQHSNLAAQARRHDVGVNLLENGRNLDVLIE